MELPDNTHPVLLRRHARWKLCELEKRPTIIKGYTTFPTILEINFNLEVGLLPATNN